MKNYEDKQATDEGRASAARVMTGGLTARAKILQLPGRVTTGVQHMRG
jgi:hypothetical protein